MKFTLSLLTVFFTVGLSAQTTIQEIPQDYYEILARAQKEAVGNDPQYALTALEPYLEFLKTSISKVNSQKNKLNINLTREGIDFIKKSGSVISSLDKAPYSFLRSINDSLEWGGYAALMNNISYYKETQLIYLEAYIESLKKQGALNDIEKKKIRYELIKLAGTLIYFSGNGVSFSLYDSEIRYPFDNYHFQKKLITLVHKYADFMGLQGTIPQIEQLFYNAVSLEQFEAKRAAN